MAQFAKRIAKFRKGVLLSALDNLVIGVDWRFRKFYWQGPYRFTFMCRRRLGQILFPRVKGSVAKTTAKYLIANILKPHLSQGRKSSGSLTCQEDFGRLVVGCTEVGRLLRDGDLHRRAGVPGLAFGVR